MYKVAAILANLVAIVFLAAGTLWTTWATAEPPADNGAAVVMYHRFGEQRYTATNIQLDQFDAHIKLLTSGSYNVLPLPEIVDALKNGRALPDRTVAITIDDAYLSIYTEAWPRLRQAGLPFTLFVATAPLDGNFPGYMNWFQLREMVATGSVTVGGHSATHDHMLEQPIEAARLEIERSAARFRDELGFKPELFAYPFGEYSLALRNMIAEAGFTAAFGQHSGAISRTEDRYALPRFPVNETYGDLNRFRLVVNALPIPVVDVTPLDPLLAANNNPPPYGFTVLNAIRNLGSMACYAIGHTLAVEQLGEQRIEVRVPEAFKPGRNRINCTLPGPGGRWRWLGRQFYVPRS